MNMANAENNKSAPPNLEEITIEYLGNSIHLEEIASSPSFDGKLDKIESKLLTRQETLVQRAGDIEITSLSDVIKLLNLWVEEEVVPAELNSQQRLILRTIDFLQSINTH